MTAPDSGEGSPLHYDAETGEYSLRFQDGTVVRNAKCPACGGQGSPVEKSLKLCECGIVQRWQREHPERIGRTKDGLFMLLEFGRSTDPKRYQFALWFCPSCGGRIDDGIKSPFEV